MNVDIDTTQLQEFEIHTSYSKTTNTDFDYLCGPIEYVIDEIYDFITFNINEADDKVEMTVSPLSWRDLSGSYTATLVARFADYPLYTASHKTYTFTVTIPCFFTVS